MIVESLVTTGKLTEDGIVELSETAGHMRYDQDDPEAKNIAGVKEVLFISIYTGLFIFNKSFIVCDTDFNIYITDNYNVVKYNFDISECVYTRYTKNLDIWSYYGLGSYVQTYTPFADMITNALISYKMFTKEYAGSGRFKFVCDEDSIEIQASNNTVPNLYKINMSKNTESYRLLSHILLEKLSDEEKTYLYLSGVL